jgi:hypothetical protein
VMLCRFEWTALYYWKSGFVLRSQSDRLLALLKSVCAYVCISGSVSSSVCVSICVSVSVYVQWLCPYPFLHHFQT